MTSALLKETSENVQKHDGRRKRTERTKVAIMDAVLELMSEGILVPTAQQVADRAGVGLRTYFRRFKHQDALLEAIDEYAGHSYESLIDGGDRTGSFEKRLDDAIKSYATIYENSKQIIKGTLAVHWRSPVVQRNYARVQKHLRRDVRRWLPELETCSREQKEAAYAVFSFDLWQRLREHQNLSKKKSMEVLRLMLISAIR